MSRTARSAEATKGRPGTSAAEASLRAPRRPAADSEGRASASTISPWCSARTWTPGTVPEGPRRVRRSRKYKPVSPGGVAPAAQVRSSASGSRAGLGRGAARPVTPRDFRA
ncbi:MAG: hypothetical protein CSA66_03455 [Proteobacteria bacterium]|nr:MAG: hypothetical protein CSA66_03455 [Pseudomonadota bacterium]